MLAPHNVLRYRPIRLLLTSTLVMPVFGAGSRHTDESCLAVNAGETYTLTTNETRCCVKIRGTIVTNGYELTITDQGGLRVHKEGMILIDGSVALQAGGSCMIDGYLKLSASGAQLSVQQDTTFTGSGMIVGQSDSATVAISPNRTFTTQVDVVGRMQIDGLSPVNPGVFKLDSGAMVHANVSGEVIEFMADTVLTDSGTDNAELFKASEGGELMFSKTATDLAAAFEINGAVFDFDQNISTTGDLNCSGSPRIEVASGKVFRWDSGSLDSSESPYISCP